VTSQPDPRFSETWTDHIRHHHAEISPHAAITYTRRDGQTVTLTSISLGTLLPDNIRYQERPYYLQADGTTSDGQPSFETYHDTDHWPPELDPLLPALRNAPPAR
jgi:hypothetical protein